MKICLNSQNKKPKQETLNTKNLNKNWTNAKMFMMQILQQKNSKNTITREIENSWSKTFYNIERSIIQLPLTYVVSPLL